VCKALTLHHFECLFLLIDRQARQQKVYVVMSLPNLSYTHRIYIYIYIILYMVLANPSLIHVGMHTFPQPLTYARFFVCRQFAQSTSHSVSYLPQSTSQSTSHSASYLLQSTSLTCFSPRLLLASVHVSYLLQSTSLTCFSPRLLLASVHVYYLPQSTSLSVSLACCCAGIIGWSGRYSFGRHDGQADRDARAGELKSDKRPSHV